MPSRDAVDQARAALTEEARINAPSGSSMGQLYRRKRRKVAEEVGDQGLNAINPLEMIIPHYLENTVLINESIQIGGNLRKLIVFSSPSALQMLDNFRDEIAIDGTFKVKLNSGLNFKILDIASWLWTNFHNSCYYRLMRYSLCICMFTIETYARIYSRF